MKKVKKVFNVEYDLTSEEFKETKQDMISEKCQAKHGDDFICKVTTFCVPDKQIVISTTEDNRNFMGAGDKLLAHRPLAEQSFLNMDDDMVKTYEITITADTDLADYVTAIDVAQAKADEMFEKDDSKLPLVTVIDYRWGNVPMTLTATVFTDVDEDGNRISLIGDTKDSVAVGDAEAGKNYLAKIHYNYNEINKVNIDNTKNILVQFNGLIQNEAETYILVDFSLDDTNEEVNYFFGANNTVQRRFDKAQRVLNSEDVAIRLPDEKRDLSFYYEADLKEIHVFSNGIYFATQAFELKATDINIGTSKRWSRDEDDQTYVMPETTEFDSIIFKNDNNIVIPTIDEKFYILTDD